MIRSCRFVDTFHVVFSFQFTTRIYALMQTSNNNFYFIIKALINPTTFMMSYLISKNVLNHHTQRRLDTYAVHMIVHWTQSDSASVIACFTFLTGFSAIPLFHAAQQPKWPRGWMGLTGYSDSTPLALSNDTNSLGIITKSTEKIPIVFQYRNHHWETA